MKSCRANSLAAGLAAGLAVAAFVVAFRDGPVSSAVGRQCAERESARNPSRRVGCRGWFARCPGNCRSPFGTMRRSTSFAANNWRRPSQRGGLQHAARLTINSWPIGCGRRSANRCRVRAKSFAGSAEFRTSRGVAAQGDQLHSSHLRPRRPRRRLRPYGRNL